MYKCNWFHRKGAPSYSEQLSNTGVSTKWIYIVPKKNIILLYKNPKQTGNLSITGQEQAHLTGKRLADMNYPYTKLICSTMTRARETADIIHKYLSELPREEDALLREGAPIPPEPPTANWRPEAHVRISKLFILKSYCSL